MANHEFWGTRQVEGPFDYVIIGAGMGGMSCAAALAKMGRRVLLLEQHYVPGGFAQTFRRKHWVWDVGVHMIPEASEDDDFGKLSRILTDGRLQWAPTGDIYDHYCWPDGFRFDYPTGHERYMHTLCERFPAERVAIERWFALVEELALAAPMYFKLRGLPPGVESVGTRLLSRKVLRQAQVCAKDALDALTGDERLKAVLGAQWFYWGTSPRRSWVVANAVAQYGLCRGAYYPVGGADAISRELLRTVREGGGWTRTSADVTAIIIERGRAVGVRVKGRHGAPDEEIRAGAVISAAGVVSTVERLLPPEYREKAWGKEVVAQESNVAYVCLYLGFEGDIREAGASAANLGYCNTWDLEATWQITGPDDIGQVPFMWVCFNTLKDPLHDPGPQQRHAGEVMAIVPWSLFEPWQGSHWRRRPEEYERLKQAISDALLRQFLAHMPALAPMIKHVELSTPLSTDHFVRPIRGSMYGLHATTERFASKALRPRSPVKGLYFAGNETVFMGIVGAAVGGALAALAAEPVRGLRLLRPIL